MNTTLWRPVVCRDGWIKCRRSRRLSMLIQSNIARESYEAVVVRVRHGARSANILVPTRDSLKSILNYAIDYTTLPMRACARGMRFEFFSWGNPIGPSDQWLDINVLIELSLKYGSLSSDPRFETTARSLNELPTPIHWIDCEVEVREGDEMMGAWEHIF